MHSAEVTALIKVYMCLFKAVPTPTHLIKHDVDVGESQPIQQHFYRVSKENRRVMESEDNYMLENNIAQPSSSSWVSPCLLINKSDGSPRFCTDFHKVNMVTKPDAYRCLRWRIVLTRWGLANLLESLIRSRATGKSL